MKEISIAVVGLGYVGLPLAVALAQHFPVVGFDVNQKRIERLQQHKDDSHEVPEEQLQKSLVQFTADGATLQKANFFIVCVPTPIDEENKPDLRYVELASRNVGKNLQKGAIVVYESTVYPGVTEDICVPILAEESGLQYGRDFKVGYSPERMNPGDKERTVDKIIKVVSGSDAESLAVIDSVYGKITRTHRASSIKVAEAAKVIENIQRDLNIALMNELAVLFDKMDLNIHDVLAAAGTKWNFHKYHPGLVGGHCIGVDPYYLTHKAKELGHNPEVILAGRKINDAMHSFYAGKIMRNLNSLGKGKGKVLILGLTFKPNVSDARNSRVKHLIRELQEEGIAVSAFDPLLSQEMVEQDFSVAWHDPVNIGTVDLAVIAVEHDALLNLVRQENFKDVPLLNLRRL